MISRVECFGIAAVLNINAKALRAALEYFDDLNIFLYNPSVLPDVVFSNPLVYFPVGYARNGVFCALVVYVLTKCSGNLQWRSLNVSHVAVSIFSFLTNQLA